MGCFEIDIDTIRTPTCHLTQFECMTGVKLAIPLEFTGDVGDDPDPRREYVRFELNEENHDIDENIEWEEDFTSEDGRRVMIGLFTLYKCSDEEGEGKGGYGNFFYNATFHLGIGLKA
jgi:hypothetical protein